MKDKIKPIIWLIARMAFITIGIAIILFIVGWFLGWRTTLEYTNAYFIVGAILIAIGTLSVMGGFMLRGSFPINYAQSAGVLTENERTNQNVENAINTYSTLIILTSSGAILILLSIIIDKVGK